GRRNVGNNLIYELENSLIRELKVKTFQEFVVFQELANGIVILYNRIMVAYQFVDFGDQDFDKDPQRHGKGDDNQKQDERYGKVAVPVLLFGKIQVKAPGENIKRDRSHNSGHKVL